MTNINIEEYKKLKQEVEMQYKQINSVYSPALKTDIIFNANGLYHLHYDNTRTERNKSVQFNKLRFFGNAVDVIRAATTIQEYRRNICPIGKKKNGRFIKTSLVEWFAFWAIISFVKSIRIRVIIRRVGGNNGQYHFWSVMPFWKLQNKKRIIGLSDLEDE